mmetsp:Transcript_34803/g.88171  ORF Transcript_34803/g.88171 Transcript_34803/m.88171 type:complete len:245 (+) Transcript_34803:272-1006(+)
MHAPVGQCLLLVRVLRVRQPQQASPSASRDGAVCTTHRIPHVAVVTVTAVATALTHASSSTPDGVTHALKGPTDTLKHPCVGNGCPQVAKRKRGRRTRHDGDARHAAQRDERVVHLAAAPLRVLRLHGLVVGARALEPDGARVRAGHAGGHRQLHHLAHRRRVVVVQPGLAGEQVQARLDEHLVQGQRGARLLRGRHRLGAPGLAAGQPPVHHHLWRPVARVLARDHQRHAAKQVRDGVGVQLC